MISSTRAAYAPPAARTRHISRGDTRWTIPQLLGRPPGHLGRPVARAVQRAARRRYARGHVRPAGRSGSAATRSPAVPAAQVGWWATPCGGRPSSWPHQTRGSGNGAPGCRAQGAANRGPTSCTREARRGFHAPHRPESGVARTCTARRRASTRQLPRAFRSTVTLLVKREAGRAEVGEVPRRSGPRISST